MNYFEAVNEFVNIYSHELREGFLEQDYAIVSYLWDSFDYYMHHTMNIPYSQIYAWETPSIPVVKTLLGL